MDPFFYPDPAKVVVSDLIRQMYADLTGFDQMKCIRSDPEKLCGSNQNQQNYADPTRTGTIMQIRPDSAKS